MKKPMGKILLVVLVLTTVELLIVAYMCTKAQEVVRCVPDTP